MAGPYPEHTTAVSENAIDLEVSREEVLRFERRHSQIEGDTLKTQEP